MFINLLINEFIFFDHINFFYLDARRVGGTPDDEVDVNIDESLEAEKNGKKFCLNKIKKNFVCLQKIFMKMNIMFRRRERSRTQLRKCRLVPTGCGEEEADSECRSCNCLRN
jgi:hypothetical protein